MLGLEGCASFAQLCSDGPLMFSEPRVFLLIGSLSFRDKLLLRTINPRICSKIQSSADLAGHEVIIAEIDFNSQAPQSMHRYFRCPFDVTGRLQFQESCDNFGQLRRIVVMHHVTGVIDGHPTVIPYGVAALLFVGLPRLPALLAVDNKYRTFDATKKFQSLQSVKWLRRVGAVERIELPNPPPLVVLFHAGARQFKRPCVIQSRIRLPQLVGARLDARVHAKVAAPAFAHFGDPLFHSQRRVGKIHARRSKAFDEDELTHALWKSSGIEKGNGSAHRVADELKLRYTEGSNHAFEIEDVIGKMIVAAGADPPTIAMAAAVGGDDPSRFS